MAENLKGEAVAAATRARWPGRVGWRGGVAGSGPRRPRPRGREPEARRRKAGARGARAWRAGLGGAEGRGRVPPNAAGKGLSGDTGGARAAGRDRTARARTGVCLGGRARARENWPPVTVTLLVSTRDAGRGGEGRGRTSFSELGDGGLFWGRVSPRSVVGEGFAAERARPGRGEGGFPNGRAGLPHARGRRGDSVCWGRWAPLGEGSCGEDGFHRCEGEL